MANPFENEDDQYLVLINDEGQHSLWPTAIDVPAGWAIGYGPSKRSSCIEFVNANWTDMRPKSLISFMAQ